MKSIVTVAAAAACCLALAACGEAEVAEEPVVAEPMAAEEPATAQAMAADGQPAPGTYEITLADGTILTETVNEDGSYSWTNDKGESGSGTWRTDGPNVWCTTEPGEAEDCNDEMVDANGVWTSVDRTSGDTATLRRVDPTL